MTGYKLLSGDTLTGHQVVGLPVLERRGASCKLGECGEMATWSCKHTRYVSNGDVVHNDRPMCDRHARLFAEIHGLNVPGLTRYQMNALI